MAQVAGQRADLRPIETTKTRAPLGAQLNGLGELRARLNALGNDMREMADSLVGHESLGEQRANGGPVPAPPEVSGAANHIALAVAELHVVVSYLEQQHARLRSHL